MAETIKDYLVGLGFQVDDKTFKTFLGKLNEATKEVEKNASAITNAYIKAGTAVVSALVSITAATAALIDKTAQADLKYQKFALHMYTTNEIAKRLKIATDALGESLDDIAWMPELRQRYMALMQQSREMETPHDAQGQLKFIRDIRFELTRLKVEAAYGMQWLSYYLIKNLSGPLHTLQSWLHKFNDWLTADMSSGASKTANVLTMILQLAGAGARAVFDLGAAFKSLWGALPTGGKIAAGMAGFTALGSIPVIGPFLQACVVASTLITGILILLEDFYGYIDGRKSSKTLSPIWKMLIGVATDVNILVGDSIRLFRTFFGFLINDTALNKTTSRFENMVSAMKWLSWIISGMAGWLTLIFRVLIGLVDTLGLVLSGRFKEASVRVNQLVADAKAGYKAIGEGSPLNGNKSIVDKIGQQESEGNYNKINPDSGALGKYQIMPKNWKSWSKEADLGVNQDLVANYKIGQYMKMFGGDERLVAAAWYAGEGYAKSLQAGKPLYDVNKKHGKGKYPSVGEYIAQVTGQPWGMEGFNYLANASSNYANMNNQPMVNAGDSNNINVGGITVHVAGTNATPEQIYMATLQGVQDATNKRTVRQLRDAAGVIR
jgi:hypothetical protein